MDNEIREYKSKSKSNRFPKLYLGLYEEFNSTFNKTYKNLKDNFLFDFTKYTKVLQTL